MPPPPPPTRTTTNQSKEIEIATDDLLQLLGKAITCAVLGKAGPQRSRQMGVLLRDERVESLARVPGFSTHAQVRRFVFFF